MIEKKVVKKDVVHKKVPKEKGSIVQTQKLLTAEGFRRRNLSKSKGSKKSI